MGVDPPNEPRHKAGASAEEPAAGLPRSESGELPPSNEFSAAVVRELLSLGAQQRGLDQSPSPSISALEGPETMIGRYRLLQLIGEGGFGAVFLAEQEEPIRRRVAVKVIKLGMDTRQVVARFEQERQTLALMDHPSIARVLDAGATEGGRPYFVMEFVPGDPITAFCDANRLEPARRLDLFLSVCEGVQHAHQKGIIHRDLKPSNVLVSWRGDLAVAKVIDFGIAKATGGSLTDKTIFTEAHQFIGTPTYMSPEQAGLSGFDVDTRSDIYSLGVLLYELLTSATPFDITTLLTRGYAEVQRVIREVDPPRPSTRLSTMREGLAAVASDRRLEPARLIQEVRGDLDWIVMKALEKDRSRRYDSASDLANDIRRHLASEPVLAAPPSTAYKVAKFVRRHPGPVTAGVLAAAVLVIATGVSIAFGLREAAAQALAQRRQRETQQVADFQAGMLAGIDINDAGRALVRDLQARFSAALTKEGVAEIDRLPAVESFAGNLRRVNATDAAVAMIERTMLRPAADAVEREFKDQPLVDAALRQTLSDLHAKLGLLDAAEPLLNRALDTRRRLLGSDHPETIHSIIAKSDLLWARGRFSEAEGFAREAMDRGRRSLGEDHPDTIRAIAALGTILDDEGRLADAEPLHREALERGVRVFGSDDPRSLFWSANLGALLIERGRLTEAEAYVRGAMVQRRRVLGEENPDTLTSISDLGWLLFELGRWRESEPLLREALDKSRLINGEEHPDTINVMSNLGRLLRDEGRLSEADALLRGSLAQQRRLKGNDHLDTLSTLINCAALVRDEGKQAEAEEMNREALERARRALGPNHRVTLLAMRSLGDLLVAQGRSSEARPLLIAALEGERQELGDDHPRTLQSMGSVGLLLALEGKWDEGEAILVSACARAEATLPPGQRSREWLEGSTAAFFEARDRAEPGKGFGARAEERRTKLKTLRAG